MIDINYYPDKFFVTVSGHSDGEKGKDIVCASVTILAYTLAYNVINAYNDHRISKKDPDILLQDGEARIHINPYNKYKFAMRMAFDNICTGFEILHTQYPDKVKFTVHQ